MDNSPPPSPPPEPPAETWRPPTDPAFEPDRNEEDELLIPEDAPGTLAFQWDIPGRLGKIRDLVIAPRRLFQQLADAPDIFTPLLLLTLCGFAFLGFFGHQLEPMIRNDMVTYVDRIPEAQLNAEQRAGLPDQLTGFLLWSISAIGVNQILLCGVYAFGFLWLTRYLGFGPVGYPELLSVMCFVWLPRPLYQLGIDIWLLSTRHYTSFWDLKQRSAELYPGLQLLLPADLPFDTVWGLAAFYLVGPMDLFLVIAVVLLGIAAPYVLHRPEPRGRLMVVAALLFIIGSGIALRIKMPPQALQQVGAAQAAAGLPPGPPLPLETH